MASNKRTVLSMKERLKVLDDLKMFSVSIVAEKYRVHPSTIWRIENNAPKIMEFANKGEMQQKRRKIRHSTYDELEQNLLAWFTERKTLGDLISNAVLMQKAKELKDSMGLPSDFKVSRGWLDGFKKRHDIVYLVTAHGEAVSVDEGAAKEFCDNFTSVLDEEDIDADNVYNMNETGLLWKAFPTKTLTGRKKRVKRYKRWKEMITVALCANATGTHKLMPLVINKNENPGVLKNGKNSLPVVLKNQKSAWMTQALFCDWYQNHFKPSARAHQTQNGVPGKIVLLLDNCEGHTVPPELLEEEHFIIIQLPPNTASLIQPMDQGIIDKLKVVYRQKLLRKATTFEGGINLFQRKLTIKDCIEMLHGSWVEVSGDDIVDAWKKLIPYQIDAYHRSMRQDIKHLTGDSYTDEDIIQFMSMCEEEERRRSTDKEDEENEQDEEEMFENMEEQESTNEELQHLFQSLEEKTSEELPVIKNMLKVIKNHVLGIED